ncbi:PAXIP1-associated glutamate-rich protein 1 [Lingula anatina]|uniref:PAXIP1-associated glutamate-rich protein 1 n=1 Tax=Lingula anatina TaxID=7574 RepID=A0A2R2MR04_LINAN|nr:PAXIP1-associated glutamate-rich protein 1 [Lingula anatina]|eukprot:XP_023932437.1 PAXIP1-associated glutamate-rich protein 1 [Lingula anatina]
MTSEEGEVWCITASDDDENYGPVKGVWEPTIEDIVTLYERLVKDEVLELEWISPGRRPPEKEKEAVDDVSQEPDTPQETPTKEEPVAPTEFDFDDTQTEAAKVTPKWTPGSGKTPRPQKRVASLDKILSDIRQEKKKETGLRRSPSSTPQRPGPKLTPKKDPFAF